LTAAPELLDAGAVVVVVPDDVVTDERVEVVDGDVAVAVLMAEVVETVVVTDTPDVVELDSGMEI